MTVASSSLRQPRVAVPHAGELFLAVRPRAVLFDLDGTMYLQRSVRARMAAELLAFVAAHPVSGRRTLAVLRAYRRAQESLRHAGSPYDPEGQIDLAVERSGVQRSEAQRTIAEWMSDRPLRHLARYRAPGLIPLLDGLEQRGLQLGVLSDYAVGEKLLALGVHGRFSQVLTASDPDVRVLKPNPRGFLLAALRWNVAPCEVLMVGDRHDVDGLGAAAAGMRAAIVGKRPQVAATDLRTTFVPSLEQVIRVIDECC